MGALECLHSGQFIGTERACALLSSLREPVERPDRWATDGCFAMRISRWSQPGADQMRFEIPF